MKMTIRHKIVLHFCIYMVVNGVIWFLSYYVYSMFNQKVQIIERKNTLLNTILEARRYEKNFILRKDKNHLEQAISYISQSEKILEKITIEYGRYTLAQNLNEKLDEIRAYKNSLTSLLDFHMKYDRSGDNNVYAEQLTTRYNEAKLLGRKITGDIEQIVAREHKYVSHMLRESKFYLFLSIIGLLMLSVLTAIFLSLNVDRPLKALEDAIQKIANGDYTKIPSIASASEFESLVTSLNNMINELNRRSEQLIQVEKLASLGTLTSGVAHELNNPLNNISTSLQILLEELDEPDLEYKRELLTEAEKQVDRGRDIVKALLEFSRQNTFTLKQVNLKALVNKTIRLIRREIPANIEVNVDVPDDITANLDPQRIQQVLLNLIINGVQAMKHGGHLSIEVRRHEEDKICLQIQDTGAGISEENLLRVFDPFFTTKGVEGSGLGLSIVHGIVEQHRGRIKTESKKDKGTLFRIFLPADLEMKLET